MHDTLMILFQISRRNIAQVLKIFAARVYAKTQRCSGNASSQCCCANGRWSAVEEPIDVKRHQCQKLIPAEMDEPFGGNSGICQKKCKLELWIMCYNSNHG